MSKFQPDQVPDSEFQPDQSPDSNPVSAGGTEPPDDGRAYLEALAREVIAQFGGGRDGFTRFRTCARPAYRQDVSANVNDATVAHIRPDNDAMVEELREIFNAVANAMAQEYLAAQPK